MCNAAASESGQLRSIQPCGWYKKLESDLDDSRSALTVADALADAVAHAEDLVASANFLRDRTEELRESILQPWKMQIDDYTAAVKELANRNTAFDELYECSEYTGWYQMVQDAEAAYRKVRDDV